ncbi:class I SAM-dependent methyltransferase [Photobacterium japonica]|uniref:class I SAM-dependent methyltransferase n=1 Tax=Photobacterium japonica TaxID=2910235 RepID=UPI003D0C3FDA
MTPIEIGQAYDQITEQWNDDAFDRRNGIAQHEKAIRFAKQRGLALDIGCGPTGRIMDVLLEAGFAPTGLDVSTEMLALAQRRHPQLLFVQADICEYTLMEKYDFITAWDSIWHIPLSQQAAVMGKIVASLNVGGIFIFSFGGTDEAGEHTDNYMGPEVYYSSLGTQGFLRVLMDLGCLIRHVEFDQHPELHTYMIVEKA